jgi:Flp pilus assembly protein TadG
MIQPMPELARGETILLAAGQRERSGLAVVEFAIIAPILVFLVIGVLETARGLMVREVLSDAARRACRTGILPGTDNAAITNDVNSILADNNIKSTDATITIQVNGNDADARTAVVRDRISVRVTIPVSRIAWITPLFLPGSSIESETVVMMRQG